MGWNCFILKFQKTDCTLTSSREGNRYSIDSGLSETIHRVLLILISLNYWKSALWLFIEYWFFTEKYEKFLISQNIDILVLYLYFLSLKKILINIFCRWSDSTYHTAFVHNEVGNMSGWSSYFPSLFSKRYYIFVTIIIF